jgi:hypothetical protein
LSSNDMSSYIRGMIFSSLTHDCDAALDSRGARGQHQKQRPKTQAESGTRNPDY